MVYQSFVPSFTTLLIRYFSFINKFNKNKYNNLVVVSSSSIKSTDLIFRASSSYTVLENKVHC